MSAVNPKHPATCGCSMCRYLEAVGEVAESQNDERWAWLNGQVGIGVVMFCATEDGNVGVFLKGETLSVGIGDTAEDAIDSAIRNELRSASLITDG